MRLAYIIKYSIKSLRQRGVRSGLTMLGIIIGIAAVVSLLTIGEGFNKEIEDQLSALGSNTVFITPFGENANFASAVAPTAGKLFERDAERLKKIGEVEDVAKMVWGRVDVKFKDKGINGVIQGVEPGIFIKTTLVDIAEGRFLDDNDRRVAVIGNTIAEDSFGNSKVNVNSFIELAGKKFRVIGIMKKSSGGFSPTSSDTNIMVPYEDGKELLAGNLAQGEVNAIFATIRDGSDVKEASSKIIGELASAHKVRADEKDFSVITPEAFRERIGSVIGLVTLFLGAIASISLLVGGVGIANSMFTSVVERTHEIGVLKAVGATKGDILHIFMLESAALGGIGGTAGSAVGLAIVQFASLFGVPVAIKLEIVLFAIAFSMTVGVISGIVPARKAAALSPVDALRYE